MKRLLSFLICPVLCILVFSPQVFAAPTPGQSISTTNTVEAASLNEPSWAPSFILPNDTTLRVCVGDSTCFQVGGTDPDTRDTLTLSLLSGPISYTPTKFPYQFTTTVCFRPDTAGLYRFIWQLTDKQSHVVRDTVTFTIQVNHPPVTADQIFSAELCYESGERMLQVIATDQDNDPLTYTKVSGPGAIDAATGLITYTPAKSGVSYFTVTVADLCGIDTAFIRDSVYINQPPYLTWHDSSLYLCEPQEICLNIPAVDPEGGPVALTLIEGPGELTAVDTHTGRICFTPTSTDSAVYEFVLCLTDECPTGAPRQGTIPICFRDTVRVTVVPNHAPVVNADAGYQTILCGPETICFRATAGDIDGDVLDITTSFGSYDPSRNQVCFTADTAGTYTIITTATDPCGGTAADTTVITVSFRTPPTVSFEQTADTLMCTTGQVCYPATVTGDGTLRISSTLGTYDVETHDVCFTIGEPGTYQVVLSATDLCERTAADTLTVVVTAGEPPVVVSADDFGKTICGGETICFPVSVTDADNNVLSVLANMGAYSAESGQVCFSAEQAGEYQIITTATDSCGAVAADTTTIVVTMSPAPTVQFELDADTVGCFAGQLCYPVTVSDDDLVSVVPSYGQYNAETGEVCFTPEGSGQYTIILTATDSCGQVAADTLSVLVGLSRPPVVTMPDTTFYLCSPRNLCFTALVSDPDNNLASVTVDRGNWSNGQICFVPYDSGTFRFILRATDSCGNRTIDTAFIRIRTDQFTLSGPGDTTIFLCAPDSLCFPIYGIPQDATVRVIGTAVSWDASKQAVCFYSDCCITNTITVEVTTACGVVKRYTFTARIQTNSKPTVALAGDSVVTLCQPGQVCLPVTVTDIDNNLTNVTAVGGTYDAERGVVCVNATATGVYPVTVTALDDCGGRGTATATVRVTVNRPPTVSFVTHDSSLTSCVLDQICLRVVSSDPDSNRLTITPSLGAYDATGGQICFTPTGYGTYQIIVTATDPCGSTDVDTANVTVGAGGTVDIACNNPAIVALCEPGQVCVPVAVAGSPLSVESSLGTYADGRVCFQADTAGLYAVRVIATATCNTDTCSFVVPVNLTGPVNVTCGLSDTSIFLCETPDTIRIPVSIEGAVGSVRVTPVGTWAGGVVSVPVDEAGDLTITVVAANRCYVDSCSFTIHTAVNNPPLVSLGSDTTVGYCGEIPSLRLHYSATDPDGNLTDVTVSAGTIEGFDIVFQPTEPGEYPIIITAVDACGVSRQDTVVVTYNALAAVELTCPLAIIPVALDVPDTVRVHVPVTPSGANVTVSPSGYYDAATGDAVLYIETEGSHPFTVIATGECNSDTCAFTIEAHQYTPPTVTCRGSVDTLLCLTEPTTVCLPVSISPANAQVDVSPIGTYADGQVCLPISEAGEYMIRIIATDSIFADTCYTNLTVTGGHAPTVDLGSDFSGLYCNEQQICIPASIGDLDNDIANIAVEGGTYDPATKQICFAAYGSISDHVIRVTVTDSCGLFAVDDVRILMDMNQRPHIEPIPDTTVFQCSIAPICLPILVGDFDGNLESIVSNIGVYSAPEGGLCFTPEGPGTYIAILTAADSCGATRVDTTIVTVVENRPPTIANFRDTTIYLCSPVNVCLPVSVADPDNNILSTLTNRGSYTNGSVCFVPYDSGQYPIILTVTDQCGRTAVDTAIVTVKTDQQIVIGGPRDTTIFLCQPESLCFPITGVPANAAVRVIGTAVEWDAAKQAVCFYSECCIQNNITVEVTTACGVIKRLQFIARIQTNSKPMVQLPNDTTLTQCAPGQLCFPASIIDIDNNVQRVNVTGGTYDAETDQICLTTTGAGTYILTLSATDECGATGTDQMFVHVLQNSAPHVSYEPIDSMFMTCGYQTACVPVTITDADNNLLNVTVVGGTYDAENGTVCFTMTDTGIVCVPVIATDICGLKDSIDVCISVRGGTVTDIICPSGEEYTVTQCGPDSVFVPLTITGQGTVTTSIGEYANGTVRFHADTAGLYLIRVVATAECNSDTCIVPARVFFAPAVEIACPGNQNLFLCSPDTLCYDFTTSPAEIAVKVVTGGYLNGRQVCVPILTAGVHTVTLATIAGCHEDTCSFTVTAVLNRNPQVNAGRDSSLTACELPQICLPVVTLDPDTNIRSITSSLGTVSGGQLCFTPAAYGVTSVIVTVEDSCGAQAKDTVRVTVSQGAAATISCPEGDQHAAICKPDSVYISAQVTPSTATVRVLPAGRYNPTTGRVSVYVTQAGTYPITVIAESLCGYDTCQFNLIVTQGSAANVVCPGSIDTIMCLVQPDTLCFPVTITGTDVQVAISPIGYYADGSICVPITTAGTTNIRIIANSPCGADTCQTTVRVTANEAPVLTIPDNLTFHRCPDDLDSICIGDISATDADDDVVITQVAGPGSFRPIGGASGSICFLPSRFGDFELVVRAADGCHNVLDTIHVSVIEKPDCDVCVRVEVDGGECTPVGIYKSVDLLVNTNKPIGGFDLLMSYDASAISFQSAAISSGDIKGWEYFRYTLNAGNCGSACPSGVVRLVGLAETNNGANHPPDSTLMPDGLLARMNFLISSDQNLGGQYVPINFVWYDCGDNSFSDTSGTDLFIDRRIYNSEHLLLWDETDDVLYPESARQFGLGAPDECIVAGSKGVPTRCIEYINGGICIIHPDSIDDRGDINLNGLAYEIADAVVFTNYFIKGLSAFTINVAGQIAASDVTADGLTLTVADLAYLIRVIVGDAEPVPKITPYPDRLSVSAENTGGLLTISTDAVSTIGAAYLVCDVPEGVVVLEPRLTADAGGMDLKYSIQDGQLRLLIYNIGSNSISAGHHTLLEVPFAGEKAPVISYAEMADYDGRPYKTSDLKGLVPTDFALDQNYPNPFNPSTQISFALPQAADWSLQIYNVSGALVHEFQGSNDAGTVDVIWNGDDQTGQAVASGVYLYRLAAGQFSQTRKMVLLK